MSASTKPGRHPPRRGSNKQTARPPGGHPPTPSGRVRGSPNPIAGPPPSPAADSPPYRFLHREILGILEATLAQGPVCVLTNGLPIKKETAFHLRRLSDASEYSLDLRVSLDGWDAATNDLVRGAETYERVLSGVRHLVEAGLNPVVTVTEACKGAGTSEGRARLLAFLRDIGLTQPRLKVMPLLRLGAEARRTRPYEAGESLRGLTLTREDAEALVCTSGRMATSRGVYVCPILLDYPEARLGATLAESLRPFPLAHSACYTCHAQGLSCRT